MLKWTKYYVLWEKILGKGFKQYLIDSYVCNFWSGLCGKWNCISQTIATVWVLMGAMGVVLIVASVASVHTHIFSASEIHLFSFILGSIPPPLLFCAESLQHFSRSGNSSVPIKVLSNQTWKNVSHLMGFFFSQIWVVPLIDFPQNLDFFHQSSTRYKAHCYSTTLQQWTWLIAGLQVFFSRSWPSFSLKTA